ncbi:MAG TPA: hypothetical protein VIY29_30840, partial [Ktedonobacteraceae bacterium]
PDASPEQVKMIQDAAEQWRKVGNEAPVQAVARVEDAAKQLIALTSGLQGLYFAVFAFSDLRKQVGAMSLPVPGSVLLLCFFLPIVLWLLSLYCATRVFLPQVRLGANINDMRIGAWQNIKQTYEKTRDEKLAWLAWSHRWLIISFAAVLVILVTLAFLPAPSLSGPTPIIIITPTSTP